MKNRNKKNKQKIVRAWTDPAYRASLSPSELRGLPPNPAGDASEEQLLAYVGGGWTFTSGCDSMGCGTWCPTSEPTCGSCACTNSCTTCYPELCGTTSGCQRTPVYPC